MTVGGIDKILCHDIATCLQTGDITIETTAHLRTGKAAKGAQLPGYHTTVVTQDTEDRLFYGAFCRNGMFASAVIEEVGPPRSAYKTGLPTEELTIHAVSLGNHLSFPFP